jgi:histidine ammonia-lyase
MNKLMLPLYGEASFEFGSPAPQRYSVQGYAIYSAAALVSELKQLAAPVTLNAPPLDLDVEDHATLAPQAVMLSRHALELLELVLAIEVLVATSVLQARPAPPRLGNGTRPVYDATFEPLARSASSATVVETVRRRLLELV